MRCFIVGVLFLLLASPVFAAHWQEGDNEFILQASAFRDQQTEHWTTDVSTAWAHYVTPRQQLGTVLSVLRIGGEGGAGIGPWYEWSFACPESGCWFLGGEAQYFEAGLDKFALASASGRFGFKKEIGSRSAFRISGELSQPIDGVEGKENRIKGFGIHFGLSIGSARTAP